MTLTAKDNIQSIEHLHSHIVHSTFNWVRFDAVVYQEKKTKVSEKRKTEYGLKGKVNKCFQPLCECSWCTLLSPLRFQEEFLDAEPFEDTKTRRFMINLNIWYTRPYHYFQLTSVLDEIWSKRIIVRFNKLPSILW